MNANPSTYQQQQTVARLARELREAEFQVDLARLHYQFVAMELKAEKIRLHDSRNAGWLAQQGGPAVAAVERWLAGE